MDIKAFLKVISRYKWIVILVPIIVVTITYFLVQNLPKQYSSESQIATGLLDPSKKVISSETVDLFKTSQQFNTMMEKLKSKKLINLLAYNLIIHELENPQKAFKKYKSEQLDSLRPENKVQVIKILKRKLDNSEILTVLDNNGPFRLYDLVESMGYGENGFGKALDISHTENSDDINIKYTSPNPDLSAYVVNTLASEFISSYSTDVNTNQNRSLTQLDSVLKSKEAVMIQKNADLADFKKNKGVLNLTGESTNLNGQITNLEIDKTTQQKVIDGSTAQLLIIARKLNGGSDADLGNNGRSSSTDIINLQNQLRIASNTLVDNGFKPADQRRVDSLRRLLSSKSSQNNDDNVIDPRINKTALLTQKTNLELGISQARASLQAINSQLNSLKAQYKGMVPYDADIAQKQNDADFATKDYQTFLVTYNQNKTDINTGFHLTIEQYGLPGAPEPSKRAIILAGSGIGSVVLCLAFLFVIFVSDNSINDVRHLEKAVKSKAVGTLNMITGKEKNIRDIWDDNEDKTYAVYRDLLRSLRFEISNKLDEDDSKILGITSLINGEGKTLIAHSLAYAFAMTGKKILLIADDFPMAKSESTELVTGQNFQTFLVKKEIQTEDLITVMNKNMAQNSLLEMHNIKSLKIGFEVLRKEFDIIIIDVNSLHNLNIAKEWLLFTEKNIAVFEAGRTIKENDLAFVKYIKEQPGFIGWILNKFKV
ncbi:lipopolysaccharide biosynthesis protein [Mucilaginibacter corticis]|uniref:Lipopolysaccharide biosynthesis protein n=1 Tax=Mucilaginibacter corticis TaxID=2597670 RepID=A0A556MLI1_9SPHI|nr:Wzz/FepE/Etk N-terminal domain-containing protein [Mucilaginibacter corticis]TSJ40743.1 lipopolysaccharide biosynthesis protein [Mucilaginibacter corticis]